jgi:hypothetical protein
MQQYLIDARENPNKKDTLTDKAGNPQFKTDASRARLKTRLKCPEKRLA